jgi:RNA polymerase sigma-70 factor (TIGR02952 family)
MAHPLDAERSTAGSPPGPPEVRPTPRPRPTPDPRPADGARPRPTPRPRPAIEPVPGPRAVPVVDERVVDERDIAADVPAAEDEVVDLAEAGLLDVVPGATGPDVWGMVGRAQEGDAEAFGELYDHYVTLVHRYAYHRVGDRATAEDVTSETFVRALRRIDSLSFQGRDVGAWLVTIARNIIRDQVKSSRYRLEVTTADMRDADRVTDGPEDAVVQHLTNKELLECVQQLGSEQQECIVLRFLYGFSVSETAEIMGKKDGAIKALQHRAVRRLAGLVPDGLR